MLAVNLTFTNLEAQLVGYLSESLKSLISAVLAGLADVFFSYEVSCQGRYNHAWAWRAQAPMPTFVALGPNLLLIP
jgi:hypothetical protein